MTTVREVLREAASAVCLSAVIEFGAIGLFLVGVAVAFVLSVSP